MMMRVQTPTDQTKKNKDLWCQWHHDDEPQLRTLISQRLNRAPLHFFPLWLKEYKNQWCHLTYFNISTLVGTYKGLDTLLSLNPSCILSFFFKYSSSNVCTPCVLQNRVNSANGFYIFNYGVCAFWYILLKYSLYPILSSVKEWVKDEVYSLELQNNAFKKCNQNKTIAPSDPSIKSSFNQ